MGEMVPHFISDRVDSLGKSARVCNSLDIHGLTIFVHDRLSLTTEVIETSELIVLSDLAPHSHSVTYRKRRCQCECEARHRPHWRFGQTGITGFLRFKLTT